MKLLGEYPVSVDNKGRLRVPTGLLKQLGDAPAGGYEFVVNKSFEPCLTLYPKAEWEKITDSMENLSELNPQHRLFTRRFYSGVYPTQTDSADRILLQKPMMEYAGLTDEAILLCKKTVIEIWSPERYEEHLKVLDESFSDLAQSVYSSTGAGILGNSTAATPPPAMSF